MAFCAFMSDYDSKQLVSNLLILFIDIAFYIVFLLIGNLIFIKYDKEKRKIYAILISIGQLTFFSMPILSETYGSDTGILIPLSLMSIAFRIFTYLYSYIVISGEKLSVKTFKKNMKNAFINPIMIFMFLGLIIWIIQNYIFQVNVDGKLYGFLRIDKTLPALYKIFQFGNNMATPLCMLMIGVILGESKFLNAIKNKLSWLIAVLRVFIVPLCILGLCILLNLIPNFNLSEIQLASLVIGNAAPVGAVVGIFCVNSNKEPYVASDSIFLSTLLSLIFVPILFVLVKFTITLPLFS